MPVVTALRATRRGGVALHVDDAYVCVVSESLVARWRLFKGRELSADDVDRIRAAASSERVMSDAYRLLGHRARSAEELRRRLLAKDHDAAAVSECLQRLAADGFLDDAAFARSYVADKRAARRLGLERIRRGLRELGVDLSLVDAALDEAAPGGGDELNRALAVLASAARRSRRSRRPGGAPFRPSTAWFLTAVSTPPCGNGWTRAAPGPFDPSAGGPRQSGDQPAAGAN